ncbi:MAG: hypothetical protein ACJA2W_001928 [Planctomycetota bacterium]|jgi:hypothetical protein
MALNANVPGLTPWAPLSQDADVTPQARFDALEKEAADARSAWSLRARAAREAGEAFDEANPNKAFVPRFAAAAKELAGTEGAVPFLWWCAVKTNFADESYMTLLRDHGKSPQLESMASSFGSLERYVGDNVDEALGYLQTIAEENPDPRVKAWATFGIHSPTINTAAIDSKEFTTAEAAIMAALKDLDDDRLKTTTGRAIGVRKKFSIGMVAPDIKGPDIGGETFSLSDYRGKVVFLDFWGDW